MYEKFGEMSSYIEINELAANLKKEGDIESIRELAKENGLEDYADDFINNPIEELCGSFEAAYGKIDLEAKELKTKELMNDWVEYIKALCLEDTNICLKVREKGKSLKGCLAKLLKYSYECRAQVDNDIVKEAEISAQRVDFGICGMATAKRLIREYYSKGGWHEEKGN